ncbi:MAG: hypothetical protein KGZ50_12270 [Peptococcaceae bacterium]|nr:hypothetical protein [Peptococcaceae bacterium]
MKQDFSIRYSDMIAVELLDTLPSMRKTNGLGNSVVRIGAFNSEEVGGDFRAYIRITEPQHLVIHTDLMTYVVTPDGAESVFEAIQADIAGR